METRTTTDVVNNFIKYLSTRDLESLVQLFGETIDWFIPGDESRAPWLGRRNTRLEVENFYKLLWSETEPITAEISAIFIIDDKAAITGSFSTKMLRTGRGVTSLFCIQMTVQSGEIIRYTLLEDSYAVSEALKKAPHC